MTYPPLVLDEDGQTVPAYEQHPDNAPNRKREGGTLIRTRPPFFSCEYVDGINSEIHRSDLQAIDLKHSRHVYGLRVKDEADFPTEQHKQYALMHAISWLILFSNIRPPADELEALRRYERIITGREELPSERKARWTTDSDIPF